MGEGTDTEYTQIRAFFHNPGGVHFGIGRRGFWTELFFFTPGTHRIELDIPEFDAEIAITVGTPEEKNAETIREILSDPGARNLLSDLVGFQLVARRASWVGMSRVPPGLDELSFYIPRLIDNKGHLKGLLALFDAILHRLSPVAPANQSEVERQIAALQRPGGQIREGDVVLWDGNIPRCRAAKCLGELKDPQAVPALIAVLNDPDV